MASCSSKLQSFAYKDEAAFAENVSTMTSAQIVPTTVMADLSQLGPSYIDPGRVSQYKNERNAMIDGPHAACQITIEVEMTGHGSTMVGSPALTALESLIGWFLGGTTALTATASTTIGGVSTVSSLVTTSSGAHSPGGLVRVGVKGDGRADGQWSVVDTCSGATTALEAALPGTPTTALPDVVYAAANMFVLESSCSTGTSKRLRISTADTKWVLHGSTPASISWSGGNAGEVLKCSMVFDVAWPEPVSSTFPDVASTAPWTYNAVPNAGGGCFLQVYGTVTRQIVSARSFAINFTLGIQRQLSYVAADPNGRQIYGGASRTPDSIGVNIIVDAEGDSAAPTWWAAGGTNAIYHCLMSYSVGDGSAVACYLPRMRWSGKKPTQMDHEGLNRVQLEFVAGTDTVETASELSLSAMRWGFA